MAKEPNLKWSVRAVKQNLLLRLVVIDKLGEQYGEPAKLWALDAAQRLDRLRGYLTLQKLLLW